MHIEPAPLSLATELRQIDILADLSEADLHWLMGRMELVTAESGEQLTRAGEPAEHLFFYLQGGFQGQRTDAHTPTYLIQAPMVTGWLPHSRMERWVANGTAVGHVRLARIHQQHFAEIFERIPVLDRRLLAVMADRIRETTRVEQQQEKLLALGKLSAGLAHELNNPAAAIRRASQTLRETVGCLRELNQQLERHPLTAGQRGFLARVDQEAASRMGRRPHPPDPLDQADLESEITSWLEAHGVAEPWRYANALAEAEFSQECMDELAQHLDNATLALFLPRVAAGIEINRLMAEIEQASGRISELVGSVKDYTYMDQAPEQELDLHHGLESTLIMLKHRLRGLEIRRDYDRSLPKILGRGGELNQVWTNLLDNAAGALAGSGVIELRTWREPSCAVVEVIDHGPGIPPEIQTRVFDPFFTTKKQGEGTGLGLDTVQRIVHRHRGSIRLASRPGETRFTVRLPLSSV